MIRYIDRTDFEQYSLEISFLGMEEREENVPLTSDVEVKLLKRYNTSLTNIPYKELWLKSFENVVVPTGVWLGIKLSQILSDSVFIAIGNSIVKLKKETGEIIWTKEFADVSIYSIGLTKNQDALYVRYAYYKFEPKKIKSNFIKIDFNGNLVWCLNIERKDDVATNFQYSNGSLIVNTWNCYALYVNEQNGEILQSVWTK